MTITPQPPSTQPLRLTDLAGSPADCGLAHGRALTDQLATTFTDDFLDLFCSIKKLSRDEMSLQAESWFGSLPEHFRAEIDAMALGAKVPARRVIEYLFADIAATGGTPPEQWGWSRDVESPEVELREVDQLAEGPMCSAAILPAGGSLQIARNCDWYAALLTRGTGAVVHRVTGRVPVLALGIRGDIDVDTGVNAAGLWLHAHTLYAKPRPRTMRPRISWLFWLREALETCETLDELDDMLHRVERDRGIILIAAELFTGRAAVFEAAIDTHTRDDFAGEAMFATNHCRTKHSDDPERLARSKPGSTTMRYEGIRRHARPDELEAALAHEDVEMRTPVHLRTIYSAIVQAGPTPRIRFASGGSDGSPAASQGHWQDVPWPFK